MAVIHTVYQQYISRVRVFGDGWETRGTLSWEKYLHKTKDGGVAVREKKPSFFELYEVSRNKLQIISLMAVRNVRLGSGLICIIRSPDQNQHQSLRFVLGYSLPRLQQPPLHLSGRWVEGEGMMCPCFLHVLDSISRPATPGD